MRTDGDDMAQGRGRSGNDYLQRSGEGHQSWAAEGPSGVVASGGAEGGAGAAGEWGAGAAGGYGRSGDYGHAGGAGRWNGADAGAPTAPGGETLGSIVERHWGRGVERPSAVPTLLVGLGIGAALVYFLDPARGAARRQAVVESASRALRGGRQVVSRGTTGLAGRTRGAVGLLRGRVAQGGNDAALDAAL